VLSGSGLAWQDGAVHEVRPLDCVSHRADEMEHTFVAGPDGLEYLVFGTRHPTELGWLPRSRAVRFGWPWVEGRDDDPWDVEAAGDPLAVGEPDPRPANIRNVDEVELQTVRHQTFAYFTPDETTKLAGFGWEKIAAGHRGSVPHCHSAEEEIFVILEGAATLELWPSPRAASDGAVKEETALRASAGDAGFSLLPRRARRRDDARLRHARPERHVLLPTLEQGLLARPRRHRPCRAPRVLRRRAARGGLMAYDEALADRIRVLIGDRSNLAQKKMFGGLAFLIGGNMAVAASGQGGILVRVDPEESDELVASTPAEPMEMRGRQMAGWLRVDAADIADDAALRTWVERGASYAASLPPK
jgi:uncharacterized cupin superfamily protein/TfoX/Sxy family transcriptional regulator of competence genes